MTKREGTCPEFYRGASLHFGGVMMNKKLPRNMKRLSKPVEFTKENIDRIPDNVHGVYVIRNEEGKVMYVGKG